MIVLFRSSWWSVRDNCVVQLCGSELFSVVSGSFLWIIQGIHFLIFIGIHVISILVRCVQ